MRIQYTSRQPAAGAVYIVQGDNLLQVLCIVQADNLLQVLCIVQADNLLQVLCIVQADKLLQVLCIVQADKLVHVPRNDVQLLQFTRLRNFRLSHRHR